MFSAQTINKLLLKAAHEGKEDDVRLLLESKKASINVKDDEGDTPLIKAARQGYTTVVSLLLESKASVNQQNDAGETALIEAAYKDHKETVELLIRKKASLDHQTKTGRTALHWAAYAGHKDPVKVLLESKASGNLKACDSRTPLCEAVSSNSKDVVCSLLQNGAYMEQAVFDIAENRGRYFGYKEIGDMMTAYQIKKETIRSALAECGLFSSGPGVVENVLLQYIDVEDPADALISEGMKLS